MRLNMLSISVLGVLILIVGAFYLLDESEIRTNEKALINDATTNKSSYRLKQNAAEISNEARVSANKSEIKDNEPPPKGINTKTQHQVDNIIGPSKYFLVSEEGIVQNQYGSYVMELVLTADLERTIHVISDSPVTFFEEEKDHRDKVPGCNIGDFYVEYQATLSVIHEDKEHITKTRNYICDYNEVDGYILNDHNDISLQREKSLEEVISSINK